MSFAGVLECARRFLGDDAGTTAIEYALIAGGLSIVIAAVVYQTGDLVFGKYEEVATGLESLSD